MMMNRSITALVASLSLFACSSAAQSPSDAGAVDAASASDGGDTDGATAAKPATPVLVSLKETKGSGKGLTVTWQAGETDLTGFEVWRNAGGGAFANVKTAAGTDTSIFDATATGMETYCYKVKALRDSAESDLSTQKCLMTGM